MERERERYRDGKRRRREGDTFKGWCVWMLDVEGWMDTDGHVSFGKEGNDNSFGRVSVIHEKGLFGKVRWMELTHF